MNSIDKKSIEEVLKSFKQLKGWTGKTTKNDYEKYDIIFSDEKNRKVLAEVKQRKFDVDDIIKYNNKGYLLEVDKYNYLKNNKSVYINYIEVKDYDIIFIITFDVENIDYNIAELNCPTTSHYYNRTTKTKKVINIPIEKNSSIYVKRNGKYRSISLVKFEELLDKLSLDFMKKLIK